MVSSHARGVESVPIARICGIGSGVGRGWGLLVALGLASGLPGCGAGDGLPREAVSGAVTLDDQPLASGTITFQVANPDGAGVPAATMIDGGSYAIRRAEGPTPGSYRVMITSPRPGQPTAKTKAAQPGDGDEPPAIEAIPSQYNAKTTLTAEVRAGGGNTFDFHLKSR